MNELALRALTKILLGVEKNTSKNTLLKYFPTTVPENFFSLLGSVVLTSKFLDLARFHLQSPC